MATRKKTSNKKKKLSVVSKSTVASKKEKPKSKGSSRLGRGLSALFGEDSFSDSSEPKGIKNQKVIEGKPEKQEGNSKAVVDRAASKKNQPEKGITGEKLLTLPIGSLKVGALQARTHFNPEKINELATSIERHGIIEPLLVRVAAGGGYEIVAGERRFRAARELGLKTVPAILRNDSNELSHEVMLVENLQREDLSASEEAEGLSKMMQLSGLTQAEVASKLGKSRSYVANALRLLKLPRWILTKIEIGELSAGVARALVGLSDEELKKIITRIENENLNTRDVERLVANSKNFGNNKVSDSKAEQDKGSKKDYLENVALRDADLLLMEDQLRDVFKSKVRLREIRGGVGKMEVEYYSYDELEELLKKMS